ncbi:MAG: FAD-dependent oxidoreductase [Planctomycetota bacterium]
MRGSRRPRGPRRAGCSDRAAPSWSAVASSSSSSRTDDASRRAFVDATYEGDLLDEAGVPFVVGRESQLEFGEELNGVRTALAVKNQFPPGVDPYVVPGRTDSGLLAGVVDALPPDGSADRGVQAFCFRLALTDVPANRVAIAAPDGYDEREYELLLRSIEAGQRTNFLTLNLLPNRKTDSNNWGGASSDFVGMNHAHPLASYAERERIVAAHERWQRGLLFTLQHGERVPPEIRATYAPWGLAADEYAWSGNWPHAIYVREGRRMRSDFVQTEHHVRRRLAVERPVAMGSYNMDSHNVWRHVGADGDVRNEGDVQVSPGGPYPIDLGTVLPPLGSVLNLLVAAAVSATHIAFGSIRMEPVFLALGHAAGVVATRALEQDRAVQDVAYDEVRAELLRDGAVLELPA